MSLVQCVDWVKEAADLTGIQKVGTPGDKFPQHPYAMVYARPGDYQQFDFTNVLSIGRHNLTVQFHFKLENLEANLPEAWATVDAFMNALRTKTLENGVDQLVSASYDFFANDEDGIAEHGVAFDIELSSED